MSWDTNIESPTLCRQRIRSPVQSFIQMCSQHWDVWGVKEENTAEHRAVNLSLFLVQPEATNLRKLKPKHGPSVNMTLIDPQMHYCSLSSGFISINISTRKISNPLKQPGQMPSSSSISSTVNNDKACSNSPVSFSCSATMVKVTEYSEIYKADQKNTSLSVSKRPTFSSSVHLEILSRQSPSSTFYLYKLLSVPLCGPQDNRHTVHSSSLFLLIRKLHLSSSLEKPQEATSHLIKSCEQNIIDCNGPAEKTHHLSMDIVKSRTSRGDTSSDSMVQLANLSPLPFRARCRSSSEVVRVNEEANDVSATQQSNQRGHVEGPGRNLSCLFCSSHCKWGQAVPLSLTHALSFLQFPYHSVMIMRHWSVWTCHTIS